MGGGERRLPARDPRPAPRRRAAAGQRAAGHLRGAVAFVGWNNNKNVQRLLVQMVERGEVATAGRERPREALGPRRADLPRRPGAGCRGGAAAARREPARHAWHRPGEGDEDADGAERRRRGRRAAVVEGVKGELAGRADPAGPAVRGPGRAALAVRPAGRRTANGSTEIFEFDYLLEMYKPVAQRRLGLLRAPDPPRRPAGREARRHRRAGRGRAPGRRRPRGRAVDRRHEARGGAEIEDLARWLGLEVMYVD